MMKLREVRNTVAIMIGQNKAVIIPIERQGVEKPIQKITFAPVFGTIGLNGHPALDPLLLFLTVKAAVNWSAFHDQLTAARERDDDDALSHIAREEHLAITYEVAWAKY